MKTFREMFKEAKKSLAYWVEGAILEFTEDMVARMKQTGVSNAELARRLNVNPSYVTKLLGGNNNFTLETMVKVARTLDAEVRIHLQPAGTVSQWFDVLKAKHETVVTEDPGLNSMLDGNFHAFHRNSTVSPRPSHDVALAA